MNDLYELFETDDPSQMADRLMQLIREAIEDEGHTEETLEVIKGDGRRADGFSGIEPYLSSPRH